jgi:hypothetical protein
MEWCANEYGFNMAAQVKISAKREQWSVNCDDGGLKAGWDLWLSTFP